MPPQTIPPIHFEVAITSIRGSGLSRTITADISNTGTADAHNVWLKLEVFSQQTRILVNGQESLRVDLGTLPAKTGVTRQAALSFSLSDGLQIKRNGAEFTITITSTEHTQTMSQFYKP